MLPPPARNQIVPDANSGSKRNVDAVRADNRLPVIFDLKSREEIRQNLRFEE